LKQLAHVSNPSVPAMVDRKDSAAEDRLPAGEQLSAGRVGRAHGLDGSFYVTGARPRLLELGTAVTIAGRTAAIARRAGTDQRPIVRVHGVTDRDGAEALCGQTLTVAAADAPQLGEGEWWAHELEGCVVLDGERRVGTVTRLLELPSCEVLEVQREMTASHPTGSHPPEPLLVPMVSDAIRHIDVAARRIEVNMSFIED
jgi:16S rRNA processing protein RimM